MVLLLLQNFTGKICLFFINNYFFSQFFKYYMLHGLIYSFLSIWDFKNKWEMCWIGEIGKQLDQGSPNFFLRGPHNFSLFNGGPGWFMAKNYMGRSDY